MHWFHKVSENDIEKVGKGIYEDSITRNIYTKNDRVLRDSWEKNVVASHYLSVIWKKCTKKTLRVGSSFLGRIAVFSHINDFEVTNKF